MKMVTNKTPALLLAALLLSGCMATVADAQQPARIHPEKVAGYVRPTDAQAFERAKRAILKQLKDPDSAKFSDMTRRTAANARGEPTDTVCGKVNAKNSFGGYVGATPFAYLVGLDSGNMSGNKEDTADGFIANAVFRPVLPWHPKLI